MHPEMRPTVDILDFLGGNVDRSSMRATFAVTKTTIPLVTMSDNLERVITRPLTVLQMQPNLRVRKSPMDCRCPNDPVSDPQLLHLLLCARRCHQQ